MRGGRSIAKAYLADGFKLSPSIGAALAVLGAGGIPLLYGPQGCAVTGSALLARHFRCAMPLRAVAMNEISVIQGDHKALATAVAAIAQTNPDMPIAILTSSVVATRGDDPALLMQMASACCNNPIVPMMLSDFSGTLEAGFSRAARCLIEAAPSQPASQNPSVAILPGCHLSAGDIDEIRDMTASFGLTAIVFPDIIYAMTRHRRDGAVRATAPLSGCLHAIAIGESQRGAAEALHSRFGVPYSMLDSLSGLAASDAFLKLLQALSGRPIPATWQRQRDVLTGRLAASRNLCGRRIAIAADPDLLVSQIAWLEEAGAVIHAAVLPEPLRCERVKAVPYKVGDLADLADIAAGADMIAGPSPLRDYAARLGLPVFDCGIPILNRLDSPYRVFVGYRGMHERLTELLSLLQAARATC